MACRRRQQTASIDVCVRSDSGEVAQVFRMRSDYTLLAFGENGFVQTSEDGDAVRFGPVMIPNIILNFCVKKIDLRPFLGSISDEAYQEICRHLSTIHGTDSAKFKRLDRLNMYSTARYIIRDMCQKLQNSLRKQLDLRTRLK